MDFANYIVLGTTIVLIFTLYLKIRSTFRFHGHAVGFGTVW